MANWIENGAPLAVVQVNSNSRVKLQLIKTADWRMWLTIKTLVFKSIVQLMEHLFANLVRHSPIHGGSHWVVDASMSSSMTVFAFPYLMSRVKSWRNGVTNRS